MIMCYGYPPHKRSIEPVTGTALESQEQGCWRSSSHLAFRTGGFRNQFMRDFQVGLFPCASNSIQGISARSAVFAGQSWEIPEFRNGGATIRN